MKSVWKKIRDFPFSIKLIGVYIITLILVISLVTYEQIASSVLLLEEDRIENLDIMSKQVALNFADNQENITRTMYSRLRTFEIPHLMGTYTHQQNTIQLNTALSQTITDSTDYDFVMLQLSDGKYVSAGKSSISAYKYDELVRDSKDLLEGEYDVNSAGTWVRVDKERIYVIREIFDTEPLRLVGKAVFHMRDDFFHISESYENYSFLFYDRNGNYLTSTGNGGDGTEDGEYFTAECMVRGWKTVTRMSSERYNATRTRITTVGITYGIIGVLIGSLLIFMMLRTTTKKLRTLKSSMEQVADGNLNVRAPVRDNDDISQMSETFNYMTGRVAELLEELLEKEHQKNEAELQILEYKYRSLETQIRPHFIYNALEIINSLAKIRGENEIVEIVQRMSRYFRNITVNTTKQYITTQQEFDALEDYTEIHRMIHGEHLRTVFKARDNARNAMIPTMIVQPVVENSLKYGLRNQNEDSELIVHAYVRNDRLVLTVKDNGYGLTEDQLRKLQAGETISPTSSSGIGIINVCDRLNLLYGDDASFEMHNREEGGVKVTIMIPLTYSEPDVSDDDDDFWDEDD